MKELLGILFTGIPRYRSLNETSQPSCSESCSKLLGHLPDGNSVGEVVDYYQNSINVTEEYDQEAYAYMGVTYDFRERLWLNDFDRSPFNKSIWLVISLGC